MSCAATPSLSNPSQLTPTVATASDPLLTFTEVPPSLPGTRLTMAFAMFTVMALVLSGYLGWVAISSTKVVGCGGDSIFNCNDVINSRWSRWLGIPVSLLAFGMYLMVLPALMTGSRSRTWTVRRTAWAVVTVFGLTAGLAALWFVSLQIFVLKHLCLWCLATHLCGGLIACLLIWTRPLGTRITLLLSLISLTGFAVLAGGQVLVKPATYNVIEHEPTIQTESESTEFAPPEGFESEVDA